MHRSSLTPRDFDWHFQASIVFNIPIWHHKVSKLLGHRIGFNCETLGRSFIVLQSALN